MILSAAYHAAHLPLARVELQIPLASSWIDGLFANRHIRCAISVLNP
jgi:hypothetical protein